MFQSDGWLAQGLPDPRCPGDAASLGLAGFPRPSEPGSRGPSSVVHRSNNQKSKIVSGIFNRREIAFGCRSWQKIPKSKHSKVPKCKSPKVPRSKNPKAPKSKSQSPKAQKSESPKVQKSQNPKVQMSESLKVPNPKVPKSKRPDV